MTRWTMLYGECSSNRLFGQSLMRMRAADAELGQPSTAAPTIRQRNRLRAGPTKVAGDLRFMECWSFDRTSSGILPSVCSHAQCRSMVERSG
jgi:hypothetical protein